VPLSLADLIAEERKQATQPAAPKPAAPAAAPPPPDPVAAPPASPAPASAEPDPLGEYGAIADEEADRNGIPRPILRGLIMRESGGNPAAVGPVTRSGDRARGPTQLMTATARELGVTDPHDPRQGIGGGARYLAQHFKTFGSWSLALAAYHAGAGAVKKAGGIPDTDDGIMKTRDYVTDILQRADGYGYREGDAPAPASAAPAAPSRPRSLASLIDEERNASKQDDELDARFKAWQATAGTLTAEKGLAVRSILAQHPEMDPAYVAEHLDELQKETKQEELEEALRDSPALRAYFSDPSRAAYVKDELADASTWEWLFGRWERTPTKTWDPIAGGYAYQFGMKTAPAWARAAKGGWAESVTIPALSMKQLLGQATPEDLRELERLEQEHLGRDYGAHNPLTKGIIGAPKMLPYLVGSTLFRLAGGAAGAALGGGAGAATGPGAPVAVPAGGLTGGAVGAYAGGTAFDFLEQVGPMYRSLSSLRRADGTQLLGEGEARAIAVSSSLGLSLATAGIGGAVIKRFPYVKDVLAKVTEQAVEKAFVEETVGRAAVRSLKGYGEHVLLGGAMMAVQGAGTAATMELAKGAHGESASWTPVFEAGATSFLHGVQDMSLLAAWGPGRELLRHRGLEAAIADESARYDAIAEHAAKSKLLENAEAGEDFLGHVSLAQGAPRVFADPSGWDAYWLGQPEGKFDPRKVAADLADDGGAMYDHVKAGLLPDLSFPLEKWTARFGKTKHQLGLREDVKLSAEGRTRRQQKEWVKLQERLQEKLGGVSGNAPDDRLAQLDGFEHAKYLELLSGRRSELEAQSVSRLFRDALDHFSRTENLTPAEILQRYPLRFHGPEKAPAIALKPTPAPHAPPRKPAAPDLQEKLPLDPQRQVVAPEANGPAEGRVLTQAAAPDPEAPRAAAPLPEGFAPDLPDAVRAAILDSFRGDPAALAAMGARAKEAIANLARAGYTDGLVPELGNQKAHEAFMISEQAKGGVHVITDMPGLKARNDKLGQGVGDKALQAYGRAFSAASRAQRGKAHRMSTGDEFFAWFPDQESADAFLRDLQARLAGPDGLLRPGDQLSTYAGVGLSKDAALAQLVRAKAAAKAKYGDSRAGGAVGHGESFVFRHGDAQEAPAAAPGGRVQGAETSVVTPQRPGGEPARYAVLEASELIPSHLPDSFQPDPRYPAGVQEREYHRQAEEQVKVVQGAQKLNPALVLADTPSAVDGPPLVTSGERALVMGGNGRAMMLARAMREDRTRELYRKALLEKAPGFGLDRAKVEAMKAPVLVRVLEAVGADAPHEELVAAVRRTNEGMTQALSPRARAVAEAKNLSPETVAGIGQLLSDAGEASLRDVMRENPGRVVELLQRDGLINQQNRSSWLQGGELTDEAKERVEGMFLGRVLGSGDRMAQTAPSLLGKLERLAPALLRVQGVNPAMDEVPVVQAAIDLVNDAKRRGMTIEQLTAQGGLFGETAAPPAVANMARLLEKAKPKELQKRFDAWAAEAAFDPRQATMFAPNPTPEQARAALFRDREVEAVLFQPERPEAKEIRNLVVQHNLSAQAVLDADANGGLPAPSLAISRQEAPLTTFGEVTLLAPSALVDPKTGAPVFDADVYSPRHPTTLHEYRERDLSKLRLELSRLEAETDGYGQDLASVIRREGAMAWKNNQIRPLLELVYAREKGIAPEVPLRDMLLQEADWSPHPAVQAAIAKHPGVDMYASDGSPGGELRAAFLRDLSAAVKTAIDEHFERKAEGAPPAAVKRQAKLREDFLDAYLGPKGLVSERMAGKFLEDARRLGKREPDRGAMETLVREAISSQGLDEAFEGWAQEKVRGLLTGRRYFERYSDGEERVATLENLVREMKARGVQGGESNSPQGLGWVRAHGARKFRTLKQIQEDRNRIVPPEEFQKLKKQLDDQWSNLAEELAGYAGKAGFSLLDGLAEAIAGHYKGKPLAAELEASGLAGAPAELVRRIEVFADVLRTTPTEYFEAKPMRPVRLDEFKVAVVPASRAAAVRPILERRGLRVEVFDDGAGRASPSLAKTRGDAIAAAAEKYALLFQEKRGEIRFQVDAKGDVAGFDVTLLEGADESTAAHELGHWMGLVLGQLASRPEASEQNRELYRVALEAMGYADHGERTAGLREIQELRTKDAAAAAGKGEPLTADEIERVKAIEAKEEKLSHAFELFLAEGKAPSAALARTFARFRLWMVRLYRGLEGIKETYRSQYGEELKLSDDVRRMFDRILGAEEAVRDAELDLDAAKIEEAVRALPEQDAEEIRKALEQVSEEAKAGLYRVLLAEEKSERRQFMAGERERIAEQIGKELDQERGYQAWRFMREGRMPEGRTVPPELVTETGAPRMLDRNELVERYGADFVRQNLRGLTSPSPEKSAPIDLVAEHFGYATGDELVRELAKLPSRGEVIRRRTQEKIEELYGPALLADPQKLGEEALKAAHNEAKARAVITGMRILARRLDPTLNPRFRAVDLVSIERRAREFVEQRPLSEVSVARALQAERSAALQAIKLLGKAAAAKDEGTRRQLAAEAFDAHEVQLFNHFLFKAAQAVREQSDKDLGYMRKALGPKIQAELVKAGHDYADRVADLLGSIEFRASRSAAEVERRREILYAARDPSQPEGYNPQAAAAMVAWLEQQKALNRDPFVPDRVIENLKRLRHWSDLSGEELGELRETVQSIVHLAHVKDTLLAGKTRRERKAIIGELSQRLFETFGESQIIVDRNTISFKKRALRAIKKLKAGVIRPEEFFREADGGDLNGPFTKYLWNTVSDATHRWSALAEKVAKPVLAELEKLPLEEKLRWKHTRFTVKGQPYSMEAALAVALNWGNGSNRSKTVRGWQYGGLEKYGIQAWDGEQTAHEFLKHLTARDWELVQRIWDQLETLWPEMEQLEKRMTGLVPKKVKIEAFEVETADGQTLRLKGGYYPMVYDKRFSHAGEAQDEKASLGDFRLYQPGAERAITPHGHLNNRIEEFARPVELSLIGLYRHLSHATKDIAMREALISTYEIITDSGFRAALQRTAGEEVLPLLDKWIRDTANDLVIPDGGESQWTAFVNGTRRGLTGSVFAFNAAQSLQNLTGVVNVMGRVDPQYMWKGIERVMSERGKAIDWVKESSKEMAHRSRNLDRDIREGLERSLGKTGGLHRSKEIAMWAFQASDAVVAHATWIGAYHQAIDGKVEGVKPHSHAQAVRHADQTVRLGLTANATKDMSALMRSPHAKWFTLFAGWASSRLNDLIGAAADAKRDVRDQAYTRALRKLTRVFFFVMAGAIASDLAVGKAAADDDGDGLDGADWAKWMARRATLAPFSLIPIAGPVVRAAVDGRRDVSLAPIERVYSAAGRTLAGGFKVGNAFLDDDLWQDELAPFGAAFAETAGMASGLPVSQAKATLGYWLDDGRDTRDTLGEQLLGTVYGREREGSLSSALTGE
jgi:GGDEF domain-containing protein